MKIITPTKEIEINNENIGSDIKASIFLAGTIDNGESNNWQDEVIKEIKVGLPNLTIYNPRRDDWNKNATEKEQMEQIAWEQKYLKWSDIIIMVLLDDSKSPISLMELGQYSNSNKIVVCCTEKFYRYYNVKWICEDKNIILINTNNPKEIADIILVAYGLKSKE